MRRYALLAALAFSASVHAFLAPEHLREEPILGLFFVAGAAVELALLALLASRPSRLADAAGSLTLGGMILAYLPFVLFHLPGFPMTPEPLEPAALLTKAVELAGFAVGATLWTSPTPRRRRLGPAAATILSACLAAGLAAPPSLAGGAAAVGQERAVDIPDKEFSPDRLPVLVGDTVTWTNRDSATHTVTGDELDSGLLEPGSSFSFTFTKPGVYHCRIHRFMQGEVDVYAVVLLGPAHSIPLGSKVTLTGLAAAGLQSVTLEQRQVDGSYRASASAPVAPDGSFSFPVAVDGPASYRVRAGEELSEPVAVRPQPTVTISARRAGGTARVVVGVAPDQPGATVALERYLRERYRWEPIQRATLDAAGRVVFSAPAGARGVRLRAHLLQGTRGWGEAKSRPEVV